MIHIHPEGAGSNAFQTNRNVKLGEDAWAWSVPNLEIENNDVRCSHASTVSPVDPDQRFYLHSRGIPPAIADRLIVAGFFEEALRKVPVAPAARIARALISDKLDQRLAGR
jgi:Fe-S cluster assembly protein SufD